MKISPLDFGKNLRPSTVDAMNKINELVTAVNDLDGSEIETIKSNIEALQTKVANDETRITTNANDIIAIKEVNTSQQSDLDAIKVTLYTPITSDE